MQTNYHWGQALDVPMNEALLQESEIPARYPQNDTVHTLHMLLVC